MPKKLLFNFNREAIQNYTYVKYAGTIITATNTLEKPIKSAILKGSTKYRDIDAGEVLDVFEDGRNLELVSVKMPVLTTSNYENLANNTTIEYGYINESSINIQKKWLASDFISIEPNTSYTARSKGVTNDGVFAIIFYNKDKQFISKRVASISDSPSNAEFARINVRKNNGLDVTEDEKNGTILYLEKTTEVLPFEEHKSNILTVNEDVTLRSNGSVYDELDLLTGKLTQRIDEDGSVLTQEVVKTVDLSILDQNGNKVSSISSFNDTTHITASSGTIPPIFEGYLATKEG